MKRYFGIGDLHGHYNELMGLYQKLLAEAHLKPEEDMLIFIGDYVDGGPDVKKVIEQLMSWEEQYPHWRFILGNHDEIMVDWIEKTGKYSSSSGWDIWIDQGGRATIQSYFPRESFDGFSPLRMRDFAEKIPKDHIAWLKHRPLYYETEKYFFVHAGIRHGMKIENVKKILEEDSIKAKELRNDMLWIRDEFIYSNHNWGKKIVFGHTAMPRPLFEDNKVGIDTMPRNEGYLTAVQLPEEIFIHFPEPSF